MSRHTRGLCAAAKIKKEGAEPGSGQREIGGDALAWMQRFESVSQTRMVRSAEALKRRRPRASTAHTISSCPCVPPGAAQLAPHCQILGACCCRARRPLPSGSRHDARSCGEARLQHAAGCGFACCHGSQAQLSWLHRADCGRRGLQRSAVLLRPLLRRPRARVSSTPQQQLMRAGASCRDCGAQREVRHQLQVTQPHAG